MKGLLVVVERFILFTVNNKECHTAKTTNVYTSFACVCCCKCLLSTYLFVVSLKVSVSACKPSPVFLSLHVCFCLSVCLSFLSVYMSVCDVSLNQGLDTFKPTPYSIKKGLGSVISRR